MSCELLGLLGGYFSVGTFSDLSPNGLHDAIGVERLTDVIADVEFVAVALGFDVGPDSVLVVGEDDAFF